MKRPAAWATAGIAMLVACAGGRASSDGLQRWEGNFFAPSAAAASVELPMTAAGFARVTDPRSAMTFRFRMLDVDAVPAELSASRAVYRGARHDADIVHVIGAEGIEDFVAFASRPAVESLSWEVDVSQAAGVRHVANTFELVDASGVPRLRVDAPYVVDGAGRTHYGDLAVEGCAFDSDPSAPWRRIPVAPRASFCTLRVTWHCDTYPALVDPRWTATGTMTEAREAHFGVRLSSGDVLVGGGGFSSSVDLYHPATGTFAATGAMSTVRAGAAVVVLSSGKALVTGGTTTRFDSTNALSSSELYDPATGTFASSGAMVAKRANHVAVTFPNGKVLVAGGSAATALASAELYDPASGGFATTGSMNTARAEPCAASLGASRALVACSGQAADIYDVNAGVFAQTGAAPFVPTVAARVGSGKVFVANDSSAGLFDPKLGTFASTAAPLASRASFSATELPSGRVLLVGGSPQAPVILAATESYDETGGMTALAPMAVTRQFHSATLLADGNVLVTGGQTTFGNPKQDGQTAEILHLVATGKACSNTLDDCESGHCVDGFCCDGTCTGRCEACDVTGHEGTCVAVSGAVHGQRAVCQAGTPTPCGLICDGVNRQECALASTTTSCGALCADAKLTPSTCDGSGACVARDTRECDGHLACADSRACKGTCSGDTDCAPGAFCAPDHSCRTVATCIDTTSSQGAVGAAQSCVPFKCAPETGSCRTTCSSIDDCAMGAVCDASGQCIPPAPNGSSSSCATSPRSQEPADFLFSLAVAATALLIRRKRGAPVTR